MDFKILFSDQALDDLAEIVAYITQENSEAASRWGRSLIDHVRILQVFLHAGALVPKRPGVRKLFHSPYKIYCRIHADRRVVEILHFWHGARRDPKLPAGS